MESALAQRYHYKKLPSTLSDRVKAIYLRNIPEGLLLSKIIDLYTPRRTHVCTGYQRIVIGDYGAFIEYDPDQAITSNYIVMPGQEYRINDPKYSNHCKYEWWTTNDNSGIKIYYQLRTVSYADYKPGFYYVSPHEIIIGGK